MQACWTVGWTPGVDAGLSVDGGTDAGRAVDAGTDAGAVADGGTLNPSSGGCAAGAGNPAGAWLLLVAGSILGSRLRRRR